MLNKILLNRIDWSKTNTYAKEPQLILNKASFQLYNMKETLISLSCALNSKK